MVTLLITSSVISRGFQAIEDQKVAENLDRVVDTYKFDLDNLITKLSDWSSWDDTYRYVADRNQAFVDSNLVYSTLANLKINYMVFTDVNGAIVKEVGVDPSSKQGIDGIPDDLRALLATGSALTAHKNAESQLSGLLLLKDGPLMFASRPILTSNGQGPIRGSVIFAKYLDDVAVKNLSDIVHLPISVSRVDREMPSDFRTANSYLQSQSSFLNPLNISIIRGYTVLNDFFEKPALIVRIEYPRDITNEGSKSVSVFFYGFIVTGFIFLLVLAFFLNTFLIHRVERLSGEVERIGTAGSANERVTDEGTGDEIASLAGNINKMLENLASSHMEVQRERKKVDTFFDIVSGIVVVLSKGGKILSINKKGSEFLGLTEENALGRDWFDFVPEKDRVWAKNIFQEIVSEDKIGKYEYLESPVLDKSGAVHMFGWYNSVLRDNQGQVVATVSHGEDITKLGKTGG